MGSWLKFSFKPIVIDMPPFKYNIYRGSVTKECSAGVIGDNISKRTANINRNDNANQNEGSPTPQSPPSVENCSAENSSDEVRTSDPSIDLTSPPILDTRKLKPYQDKAADKNAELTPSSRKVDKWERMLDQGLLALKLSIERDPDLTPPPDAGIENLERTCVETKKVNGYGAAWGQNELKKIF
uniref:Uncharacterized protein n=1 Tax=Bactrocera dorsalis TaxID=27457 RepID=A0A034UYR2_BACDO